MKVTIVVIITICLIGVPISSIVFLKQVFSKLIQSSLSSPPQILTSTLFWALFLVEIVLLPFSCMRRMKGVSYISNFSSLLPIVFLILASVYFFSKPEPLPEITYFSSDPNHWL